MFKVNNKDTRMTTPHLSKHKARNNFENFSNPTLLETGVWIKIIFLLTLQSLQLNYRITLYNELDTAVSFSGAL